MTTALYLLFALALLGVHLLGNKVHRFRPEITPRYPARKGYVGHESNGGKSR